MSRLLSIGPIHLRLSRKGLSPWGYASLQIGGLSFGSRTSSGDMNLASYHPRRDGTWHWSVVLVKGAAKSSRSERRKGQWHDYYSLPFGWHVIVSQQDYHKSQGA